MKLDLFNIQSQQEFEYTAIQVFQHQYTYNKVYRRYCNLLGIHKKVVINIQDIPYLPIEFFKKEKVISTTNSEEIIFTSSGTTGSQTSKHYVSNVLLYQQSYLNGFEYFYGRISDYCVLALLPAYLERKGSSLVYMANNLIERSKHPRSGFYLHNIEELVATLKELERQQQKTILIGVSFALLEVAETYNLNLKHTIVMETGGMKGRRKELIRSELHEVLQQGFGVSQVHSEYGMTELLSQAYSLDKGIFKCPPWMQVIARNTEDPLELKKANTTGGLNIIDLANINSCSFIATQDLGKVYQDKSFEVIGRFDHSDVRGCNLMVL